MKHVAIWQDLRSKGHAIISTWIDEAGEGQTADYSELAQRCLDEIEMCHFLVLYCEPDEVLKGAILEAGAALHAGREVICIGDCPSISRVFRKHEKWTDVATLDEALELIEKRMPRPAPGQSIFDSPEWKELGEHFEESEKARETAIAANPNNGKEGWWRVVGMRHSAMAWASSAESAIDAADVVSKSWEFPEAEYVGTELPRVFAV